MSARATLVVTFALVGCAPIEWRTSEPVTPSTYDAPAFRSSNSVGRLSRLAIMPAIMHIEEEEANQRPEMQKQVATDLEAQAAEYLSREKGYETLRVTQSLDRWRAGIQDASVIRETGLQFKVDGLVVIEKWVAKPWTQADELASFFLLSMNKMVRARAPSLRVSIYETASGRLVWTTLLRGAPSSEYHRADRNTVDRALDEMENAVPAHLRR
jgi:hypothetical protein